MYSPDIITYGLTGENGDFDTGVPVEWVAMARSMGGLSYG